MDRNNFVQGLVSGEAKKRFNNHPGYRGKTQREFVGDILEQWLDSPAARLAVFEEKMTQYMERILAELDRQAERIATVESRLEILVK